MRIHYCLNQSTTTYYAKKDHKLKFIGKKFTNFGWPSNKVMWVKMPELQYKKSNKIIP